MLITVVPADSDALPVTIAEAREHCRAPGNGDDDVLVLRALKAAVAYVENHTELKLAPVTLEYRLDNWSCGREIEIPAAPVRDVLSVKYLDENASEQTVDAAEWTWERTEAGACITFTDEFSTPTLHSTRRGTVRVEFEAGFDLAATSGSGDEPDLHFPELVKIAVLMICEHWYDQRGVVSVDETHPVFKSADAILSQMRVYR